eukprot:m.46158 g.46158  ORF g.46158 m.46158 type:complete len:120 (+) comp15153_c0_seq14:1971-2330(+)
MYATLVFHMFGIRVNSGVLGNMESNAHMWQHWSEEYHLDFAMRGIAPHLPEHRPLAMTLVGDCVSMDFLKQLFVPVSFGGQSMVAEHMYKELCHAVQVGLCLAHAENNTVADHCRSGTG